MSVDVDDRLVELQERVDELERRLAAARAELRAARQLTWPLTKRRYEKAAREGRPSPCITALERHRSRAAQAPETLARPS